MNILLGDFNAKVGRKISSNRRSERRIYMKLVMTVDIQNPSCEKYNVPSSQNS
jgi:hypothetical protein